MVMAAKAYLERFASYTTMHGFPRIVASKATPKRLAWIVVFTTAWILFTIQMSILIRSYFEYPKMTSTEIVSGGVPFPSITLCNLGSFDFYTVYRISKGLDTVFGKREDKTEDNSEEETEEETEYDLEYYYPEYEEPDRKYDERQTTQNTTVPSFTDTFVKAVYKYYGIINETRLNDSHYFKVLRNKLFSRTTLAANIPFKMLSAIGVQENEFIVKCTFKNKPCKFKKMFDPYFFNCFTFTPPNEDQLLLEGIDNGFSVMLLAGTRMLKEVEYHKFVELPGIYARDSPLSGAGGIRVVIHPPGSKPFPMTEGYDVPPENMASFGITLRKQKRLGQPYGHCSEGYPFFRTVDTEVQPFIEPYRKAACERVCIQRILYSECKCLENTLPTPFDLFKEDLSDLFPNETIGQEKITFKGLTDICLQENFLEETNSSIKSLCMLTEKCSGTTEFRKCFKVYSDKPPKCVDQVLRNLVENIECADRVKNLLMSNATFFSQCECHPACNNVLYDVSYSLSQWPSKGIDGETVAHEIMNELEFTERFISKEKKEFYEAYVNDDVKKALKDFSKINVYLSDADVFLTTEKAAMTVTQLISDTGGQLGVWIGVSVITIAEVLEILIAIMIDCCRKRSNKKTEADDELKDVTIGDM